MTERAPPPAPRWVKLFAALAVVLFLLFVVLHVSGRTPHGHSRQVRATPSSVEAESSGGARE